MTDRDQFAQQIEPVAKHLWGDPNLRLSKGGNLRWGAHGSKSVAVAKGTWFDNETKEGGGVVDLVARELQCSPREAFAWLVEQGFVEADRKPQRAGNGIEREERRDRPKIVATYDYTDEAGALLFQVVRFDPKDFRQRKPRGAGAWDWNVKGVRHVPYRLRELQEAIAGGEDVFVVEGEKDVDRLISQGLAATCNAGGAGKWPADFAQYFEGAHRVVIIPDNDDAGRNHSNVVGKTLKGKVDRLDLLEIPGLAEKEDVSDWYDRGGTTDELFEIIKSKARPWTVEAPASTFGAIRWENLDDPGEELEYIIDGFYTRGDLSVTAGPSKSGKSFFMIHAGLVIALAASPAAAKVPDFFGSKIVNPGLVIYFAGEGARGIKNRVRAFRKHYAIDHKARVPFVLLTKRLDLLRGAPDGKRSDTDRLIDECKAWQAYYDLPLSMVIVDTLATATAGADENSAKDMTTVFSNCSRIKDETGAHVSLVHHMNKQGGQIRGHSSIYANTDQVVLVTAEEGDNGVRTATLDKQKDEQSGTALKFKLKAVNLHIDQKSGRQVTSCVLDDQAVEGTRDEAPHIKGNLYKPGRTDERFLRALFETLRRKGIVPNPDMHVPVSVRLVAAWEDVREAFRRKLWIDEKDKGKEDSRVRQAALRCGDNLMSANVIAKDGDFIWHTGRPIKGFRESYGTASSYYSDDGEPIRDAPPDDFIEEGIP